MSWLEGLSNDLISISCKRAQQTSRSQVFSPVEDAFDEIAATLLNLERQLCRAFLFRTHLARLKRIEVSGAHPSWLWGRRATCLSDLLVGEASPVHRGNRTEGNEDNEGFSSLGRTEPLLPLLSSV
jgi:hypothetical protein